MSAAKNPQDGKDRFSEALWFKKGEADALAAQARAEAAATGGSDAELPRVDSLPLEDRYRDDGSLSLSEAEKYSLRSGSTGMVPAYHTAAQASAVTVVTERELIREMTPWRGWKAPAILLLAASGGAVAALLLL
jgi:hypothetical protein